jgi:hypothetical protein
MQHRFIAAIMRDLWTSGGLETAALNSLHLTGAEPALPSSFRVDALAQMSVAASALAAAEFHYARGGERQCVIVEIPHAGCEWRRNKP